MASNGIENNSAITTGMNNNGAPSQGQQKKKLRQQTWADKRKQGKNGVNEGMGMEQVRDAMSGVESNGPDSATVAGRGHQATTGTWGNLTDRTKTADKDLQAGGSANPVGGAFEKARIQELEADNLSLRSAKTSLKADNKSLKSENKSLKAEIDSLKADKASLKAEVKDKDKRLAKGLKMNGDLAANNKLLAKQKSDLDDTVHGLTADICDLTMDTDAIVKRAVDKEISARLAIKDTIIRKQASEIDELSKRCKGMANRDEVMKEVDELSDADADEWLESQMEKMFAEDDEMML